jgi:hypothetical protein
MPSSSPSMPPLLQRSLRVIASSATTRTQLLVIYRFLDFQACDV